MLLQNIQMALSSIRASKLRAFLTMLGIIIGVSSVVTVLAAGAGVKQAVTDQVATYGANLIIITPGQTITEAEDGSAQEFNFAAGIGASTLTESDVEVIGNVAGVKEVSPAMVISGVPRVGENTVPSAFVLATYSNFQSIINRDLESGSNFTDEQTDQNVVVLGDSVAYQLFEDSDPIGQDVVIRQTEFEVIGVMAPEEAGGINIGPSHADMIYMPFEAGRELSDGLVNIMEIDAIAAPGEDVDEVADAIRTAVRENHAGETDFTVMTADDALALFDTILGILTSFVAAIAGISLLVGGIGVMNIMFVSVTERTREVGIRKAVGATNRNLLTQFLIEAIVISLIGGLLGIGLALLMGMGIQAVADFTPVFTTSAFVAAVVISTAVGIIFGTAPAIKAARKNPIEALRYE